MTEIVTETTGLRERNRNRTMEAITEAFSELSLVNPRFTMQELADAAGISVRTLYRYYPSRDDLIAGLYDLINRRMPHAQLTGEGLPAPGSEERIRHSFGVFGEHDKLMRAVVVNRLTGEVADPGHTQRAENILAGVRRMFPDHDDVVQRQIAGLVRLLGGSVAWMTLTDETIVLDDDEAAAAAAWALQTLLAAARDQREELT